MKEEQLKAFEEKLYNVIIKINAEYSSDVYQKWELARNIMQRRNIETPDRKLRYIFY
jgi:broad specificity phosphatase PhoE